MTRPTIEDLVTHMKKHKDAVIIIGDKIAPEIGKTMAPVIDGEESEQEKVFTRKALVKETNKFWDYYFRDIYYTDHSVPDVYNTIYKFKQLELAKFIISTDIRHQPTGISDLDLRGVSTIIKCNRCDSAMEASYMEESFIEEEMIGKNNYKCPTCNNRLRPDCLLYGENYYPNKIKEMTRAIFKEEEGKEVTPNTHTLILIGVDMQEDLIAEMYDNYLLVRERIEEPCYIVMITDKEEEVRLFTPEFATAVDIEAATTRLIGYFND